MSTGKLEAEVGLFVTVNTWVSLRAWFTESELIFYGWKKEKIPIMAFDLDQLWENHPDAPEYYRERDRELPNEVQAVVGRAAKR